MTEKRRALECAACGLPAQGNASIHRDSFNQGPEVDLCDDCGTREFPTCAMIWRMIRDRRGPCEVISLDERRSK